MEGVAGVEEATAGVGESFAGGVGEPGGGDGAEGLGVAESSSGLLEVGFEEELQFAHAFGAFAAEFVEFGEPFGGLVAPVREDGGAEGCDESVVSGEGPCVEEPEVDLEVLGGGGAGLGGGADGVVEGESEVPDRVPDAVGEGGDGGLVGAAVVEQEEVEVAAGESSARP